ncbi:MAG TPA: precorrin-6y C5,15-methyltransferase (decarboxylating) subunit CbiE [Alphaproteobacteria bacterium]|nr:precorrin-6y C5,15-methyltransferase (decarboxylating) subunit CbiE [Alphaproteobacteria bacterium]
MTAWLSVIGIGADGMAGLTPAAQAIVHAAEVLVGGVRHVAMVNGSAERLTWETPLSRTVEAIAARRGRRVVVLATGDPMWFGIGVTLARRFPPGEIAILPHLSAFSLAAARMGWPLAETEAITLHGRPLELLALHLAPGARVLVLSENGGTPARVAGFLRERGWSRSTITVLENLGAAEERRVSGIAAQWNGAPCADLNTMAVECIADAGTRILSRAPGLPDEAFTHDGQLTKREIRAATLAALIPLPGQLLWDVGAGCGSIAIEWMRAARGTCAIAIERAPARQAVIAQNAAMLGVPKLRVVAGTAPDALAGLDRPDAIFIGGGLSDRTVIDACWAALKPAGRIVANAVTLDGEASLVAARSKHGGDLTRISISRAGAVGTRAAWRPLMPVTQWSASKADG